MDKESLPPTETLVKPPVEGGQIGFESETSELPVIDEISTSSAVGYDVGDKQLIEAETTEMDQTSESRTSAKESRWQRLKRGFWKHMYEAPVDMTPMGPAVQPEIPFDEWYAEKHQHEQGPVDQAVEEAIDKTVEKLSDLTGFVDYIGNVALVNTAEFAADAAHYARDRLADTKQAAVKTAKQAASAADVFTRKADDAGNVALERLADAAVSTAEYTGRATRKTDYASRAAMEYTAQKAKKAGRRSAEQNGRATRKADYIGQILLDGLAIYGSKLFVPEAQRRSKDSKEEDGVEQKTDS